MTQGCKPPGLEPLPDWEIPVMCGVDGLIHVADEIRQLHTEFGGRPYRVFLVWVGWTADEDADGMQQGAERDLRNGVPGVGRPILLQEMELLPTPLVGSLNGIGGNLASTGLLESGQLTISEISLSYTEDVLMGLLPQFRDPGRPDALLPGVQFWWEIQEHRPPTYQAPGYYCDRADMRSPRRRLHPNTVPDRRPYQFQWQVGLVRADGERGRNAEIRDVG